MALRISLAASSRDSMDACSLYHAVWGVQITLGASFKGPFAKLWYRKRVMFIYSYVPNFGPQSNSHYSLLLRFILAKTLWGRLSWKMYDWSKVTQHTSTPDWGFKNGSPRSTIYQTGSWDAEGFMTVILSRPETPTEYHPVEKRSGWQQHILMVKSLPEGLRLMHI